MSARVMKEVTSLGEEVDAALEQAEKSNSSELYKSPVDMPARFEVDGVEYTVSFRMGQQKAFQRAMGEPVISALVAMEATPGDMLRISALFRYALTPQLDEDAADAIIDRIGFARALKLITAASKEAFSDLGGDPPKGQPAK